jgi:hypothetical protein
MLNMRDFELQDQKRHDYGKNSVAECLNPAFAQNPEFKYSALLHFVLFPYKDLTPRSGFTGSVRYFNNARLYLSCSLN